MNRIALIHTVPTVYLTFADELKKALPDAVITNTLDDYLASDAEERGYFSKDNQQRLYNLIEAAEKTHPDLIAVTCSTLSPHVNSFRNLFGTPLVTIDEMMISEAVKSGSSLLIVSTAESTVGPTKSKLRNEALLQNRTIEIENIVCNEAYVAIKKRDKALHDSLVLERIKQLDKQYDVIILAQASMAHLEESIKQICKSVVLSSPRMCIANILEGLNTI